jgi:transcriptional regulator with XRE-family HTH domain
MKELGNKIKEAREKRKLNIKTLYERTRIPIQTIEAIEEGNIEKVPKAYYRIFVRSLAKEIGIDGDTLLNEFDERRQEDEVQEEDYELQAGIGETIFKFIKTNRKLFVFVLIVLFFVVLIFSYIRYGKELFVEPKISEILNKITSADSVNSQLVELEPFMIRLIGLTETSIEVKIDSGKTVNCLIKEKEERQWNVQKFIFIGLEEPEKILIILHEEPLSWEVTDTTSGMNLTVASTGIIEQTPRIKPNKTEKTISMVRSQNETGQINQTELIKKFVISEHGIRFLRRLYPNSSVLPTSVICRRLHYD